MMTGSTTQKGKRAPYPAYKPSGVEWLGDVPEQWGAKRLHFCVGTDPFKSEISKLDGNEVPPF